MKRFALFVLIICGFPSPVTGWEVKFRQEAIVSGPVLTLADVAELYPAAEAEPLAATELFAAPEAGRQACYRSSTLKAYVTAALPPTAPIRWSGADTVCVRHKGGQITSGEISEILDKRLREALSHLPAKRIGFRPRNLPDHVSLPPGKVECDVLFSDPDVLGSRQAGIIIKVDGRVVENLTVFGRVEAVLPVVVTSTELKRGEVIDPEDIRIEEQDIADLHSPCLELRQVVGKRAKRAIGANRALGKSDLDLPVLVERRQVVTMLLQKGTLRISARGMAAGQGSEGDVVMIRNLGSNREIPCEVIGPGLTRVVF